MPANELDDGAQRFFHRLIDGKQRVRFAVETADADFEMRTSTVDDNARHFETVDLSDEPTVLDNGISARRREHVGERRDARVERVADRQRLHVGGRERRVIDKPDPRRVRELAGTAGQNAPGVTIVDDDIDAAHVTGRSPSDGEGWAERSHRIGVGEHPGAVDARERGTARERDGPPIPRTGGRVDECGELGEEQPRSLLRIDRSYFLAPLRWP
jgi:hypothetical protein